MINIITKHLLLLLIFGNNGFDNYYDARKQKGEANILLYKKILDGNFENLAIQRLPKLFDEVVIVPLIIETVLYLIKNDLTIYSRIQYLCYIKNSDKIL